MISAGTGAGTHSVHQGRNGGDRASGLVPRHATAFFGIAFVVTGFLAAFNRISWARVALVVGAMTVLPFILFKPLWWFLTAPVWYGLGRIATKVNSNGHHVLAVMMQVTPAAILNRRRRDVS